MNGTFLQQEKTLSDLKNVSMKPRKGASVYGIPMSRELASFLDDVTPEASQQRMLNMFFAGHGVTEDMEEGEDY